MMLCPQTKLNKNGTGFTLIELLIVIGLIAILAGIVFVALDPLTRFRDARNSRRYADVSSMLTALRVNQVDKGGKYTPTVEGLTADNAKNYLIGTSGANDCAYVAGADCAVTTQAACISLLALADGEGVGKTGPGETGGYLGKVPVNPKGASITWDPVKTGYYLRKNTNNSISIGACESEGAPAIEVTR